MIFWHLKASHYRNPERWMHILHVRALKSVAQQTLFTSTVFCLWTCSSSWSSSLFSFPAWNKGCGKTPSLEELHSLALSGSESVLKFCHLSFAFWIKNGAVLGIAGIVWRETNSKNEIVLSHFCQYMFLVLFEGSARSTCIHYLQLLSFSSQVPFCALCLWAVEWLFCSGTGEEQTELGFTLCSRCLLPDPSFRGLESGGAESKDEKMSLCLKGMSCRILRCPRDKHISKRFWVCFVVFSKSGIKNEISVWEAKF